MYYLSFFVPPYNSLIEGNTAPTTAIPAMKIPDIANHVSTPVISAKHPAAIKPKGMAERHGAERKGENTPKIFGSDHLLVYGGLYTVERSRKAHDRTTDHKGNET